MAIVCMQVRLLGNHWYCWYEEVDGRRAQREDHCGVARVDRVSLPHPSLYNITRRGYIAGGERRALTYQTGTLTLLES